MSKRWMTALMVLAGIFAVSPTHGAVNVGDKPQLQYRAVDGANISLESLRGKMVLIDFWASWCGPCMQQAEHMVKTNEKWAPKGLQTLGISLDQDARAMTNAANQKGFIWPQYLDANKKVAQQFGVTGIPHCVLVSPDGAVLWVGHPAMLDPQLEEAFKAHPPQLVDPKVLADAGAICDKIEAAIKAKDPKTALRLISTIPAGTRTDEKFAERLAAVQKQLEEAAAQSLAEADALVEQKQYAQGIAKYREILAGLPTLPVAATARQKLADLQKNPAIKVQIDAAERNDRAAEALAAANKMKDAGKNEQAYIMFKAIARDYASTPAGATAAQQVAAYEKDPAFAAKVTEDAAATKAKSLLGMAGSYAAAGRTDTARQKYQEVIDQFPGTAWAEKAKAELDKLK